MSTAEPIAGQWTAVCPEHRIRLDRGVAVLVGDTMIAVFRLAPDVARSEPGGEYFAVDHVDPHTGAPVMARGLVGSLDRYGVSVPTVASPINKQRYDLRTGEGIGAEPTQLRTWDIRVRGGVIEVLA